MRSASFQRRGPSRLTVVTLCVFTLLGGTVLTVLTLWVLGVDVPFLPRHEGPARQVQRPSGVAVPLCTQTLPPFTEISLVHFLNPKTGEPQVHYMAPEMVKEKKVITDVREIIGRVLTRAHAPGYAFTEKDLFPRGTRPGLVAGIPPGKRSFVLNGDRISGIHALKVGDRFNVIATKPFAMQKLKARAVSEPAVNKKKLAQPTDPHVKGAVVALVVQNGVVVQPMTTRELPFGTVSPASKARDPQKKVVPEITIAVDPEELVELAEALALECDMLCVARSGQTGNTEAEWLRVPVAVRTVAPFATVTREDLVDPLLGVVRWVVVKPQTLNVSVVTDVSKILGRAVRYKVPEGSPFTEEHFVTADMVAVPLCARPISPYTMVLPQDLLDPKTSLVQYTYVKRKDLPPEVCTELSHIVGQVLRQEKSAGSLFTDADFLPEGTPPGLAAGVPPGKRAVVLDANKIKGVQGFKVGDRIDVIVTMPWDLSKALLGLRGAGALNLGALLGQQKRAVVKVLAQNALVVLPAQAREDEGGSTGAKPKGRTPAAAAFVIAVDPREVGPLSEALSIQAEISCVARSGWSSQAGPRRARPHPEQTGVATSSGPADATPGWDPSPELRFVEIITNGKRDVQVFVAPRQEPPPESVEPPSAGRPRVVRTEMPE